MATGHVTPDPQMNAPRDGPSLASVAMTLAFLAVTIGSCGSEQTSSAFWLANRTSAVVDVYVSYQPGGPELSLYPQLKPGEIVPIQGSFPGDDCTSATLSARDPDHHELARQVGRVCRGETWNIRAVPPPSAPG